MKNRINLLIILLFLSCYIGNYRNGDPSLADGKNIINFILIYVIGNSIKKYHSWFDKFRYVYIVLFLVVSFCEFLILYNYEGSYISTLLWKYGWAYNSPILIGVSSLLFLAISQLHFQSKIVNYLARSTFPLYLIHHQPLVLNVIGIVCIKVSQNAFSFYHTALCFMLVTIGVMCLSLVLDKMVSPIYICIVKQLVVLKKKYSPKSVYG